MLLYWDRETLKQFFEPLYDGQQCSCFYHPVPVFLNSVSSTLSHSPSSAPTDIKCSQGEGMWYIITFEDVMNAEAAAPEPCPLLTCSRETSLSLKDRTRVWPQTTPNGENRCSHTGTQMAASIHNLYCQQKGTGHKQSRDRWCGCKGIHRRLMQGWPHRGSVGDSLVLYW